MYRVSDFEYEVEDGEIVFNGKKLKQYLLNSGKGYFVVQPYLGKRQRIYYVHKLLAMTIPHSAEQTKVVHKDGNPQNNSIDNLMWVTPKEAQAIRAKSRASHACSVCGHEVRNLGQGELLCWKCREKKAREEKKQMKMEALLSAERYAKACDKPRNEVIVSLRQRGLTYGNIAKLFGISRQRVREICMSLYP